MRKFLDTCRRLLSIALNLFVLCAEPIALPLSWEMGQAQIFTFYTEDSNIFAAVVCAMVAVCQLWCIFTGGELPRWLKRLKFMATSCLLLTFLTVVFVLAPMNGEGGYQERMTVYYAFAAAYAKWSWLYAAHMRDDIIDDGWEYDAPDTKNVKEAHLDGLDFRYEYEFSGASRDNAVDGKPMPYHSVLTIEKE